MFVVAFVASIVFTEPYYATHVGLELRILLPYIPDMVKYLYHQARFSLKTKGVLCNAQIRNPNFSSV